ncbi:MAG TPA: hypothetical protein VNA22_02995 [Pyrinomonadaceae bacterium]|nr:hypothetical protein [Pyrinomonadaceae bacterium]
MQIDDLRDELREVKNENEMLKRQMSEGVKWEIPGVPAIEHPPAPPKRPKQPKFE